MARLELTGFDDVLAEMKRMGELSGDVADMMLMAGAEKAKEAWKQTAKSYAPQLRDSGDMIESIGFANSPKTIGDLRTIEVYPQGKDRDGVRNAHKAFILHYGTPGSASKNAQRKREKKDKFPGPGIPATQWVDKVVKSAEAPVVEAMMAIWDEHLKGMK
jgi:hypothetical protein